MPKNATIQIKTLTPRQAINRTNENLRLGEKFKETKNIVVLVDNLASTSFSTEKKERSQEDKEIGQKINALRASIKTYQKRISQTTDEKKIAKMQSKISDYLTEIRNLENQKSGNETRGRKKEKQFVEFIFSLTNTEPTNSDLNNRFALAQAKFLEHFKNLDLVVNAMHLDQHSLHAHAIYKLPKGKTWTECVLKEDKALLTEKNSSKKLYDALKQAYSNIAENFQSFMSKSLNIRFDKLKNGVFYKSLSNYKKETGFNSDFKAVEAPKIKKETFKRENVPLEPNNSKKSVFELLKESIQEDSNYEEAKRLAKEEEQPRSPELHHDDETGSSHGDVEKQEQEPIKKSLFKSTAGRAKRR